MYCFTYASSYDCVFNELILWSDISSEHPIVAKTLADLSGKKLSKDIEEKLNSFQRDFADFKKKVVQTREQLVYNQYYRNDIGGELRKLISEFLIMDEKFLKFIEELKKVAPEDKVWQTLMGHFIEEQTFMKKLFEDLKLQMD
ncbi:MAG: DUF2935 domain-containing protein [Clostridiales bacterium]|uniref:DUF2935 domain-containing protein n=1 Tax=Clostridium sp. N3C TaxID=1776758 RepID=UPI00092E14B4|nr:DUF2935 domain-containing protein [Clostridium sp. N3C]NLZ49286.1 DUF2935 domain-containing protein [Clostridiales bacterium]SCN25150.1 hypothetical protein N3C_2186 [Clostridium sp. N3C]